MMKKTILIFDDDRETLSVSKMILEQQDYKVEIRDNCDNIIEDINQENPDIVLMDLWMPETGGENAIILMKNNSGTRHIPAILFSANDEIEEICRRSQANGYLKKPFSIAELLDIIDKHVGE